MVVSAHGDGVGNDAAAVVVGDGAAAVAGGGGGSLDDSPADAASSFDPSLLPRLLNASPVELDSVEQSFVQFHLCSGFSLDPVPSDTY